ncbi:MAG: glycosyltransferase family 2 protein [Desulfobacteraceae bacterium]|nr:glycosyltransferase family 2 protein [Desulfobacteraceae bacterium]
MKKGISVIIPTYNGGQIFSQCLEMIGQQDYGAETQLIIVDSGSTDGTIELAESAGALIRRIDKKKFHHSNTRNEAVFLADFDNIVFTVQDAVPCSKSWLSTLERSLCETDVAAVYTDQIPHDDATPYSRFEIESISKARGQEARIQSIDSLDAFNEMPYDQAYRAIGLDNVCAIYRKELLVNIPFPEVDFAEDMAWALKNMLLGHRVMYKPRIKVKHSHNRSPEYAFNRQVINSLWCAKIMNRVKDDLSFVTIRDLMSLTRSVGRYVNRIGSEILGGGQLYVNRSKKRPQAIKRIRKAYSLRNRVSYFLDDKFPKLSGHQSPELRVIEQHTENGIGHVLNLIEKEYKVTREEELIEALDQSVANILGRIYGEVYASCMLGGKISSQLEAFMKPYIQGI